MSTHLQRLLNGIPKNEVNTFYDDWATKYDEDVSCIGYEAPTHAARVVMETIKPKEGERIVDFAAGTGHVAERLRDAGLPPAVSIDAVDASPEMLRVAEEKRIYANCFVGFIGGGAELPFEKESYDVATMIGGFCESHVPIDGWDSILDAVKPGGHVVCSISSVWIETVPEYLKMNEYVEEMCERKGAEVKEKRVYDKSYYDFGLILWVLRKNVK